jgi:hypothetical protein
MNKIEDYKNFNFFQFYWNFFGDSIEKKWSDILDVTGNSN